MGFKAGNNNVITPFLGTIPLNQGYLGYYNLNNGKNEFYQFYDETCFGSDFYTASVDTVVVDEFSYFIKDFDATTADFVGSTQTIFGYTLLPSLRYFGAGVDFTYRLDFHYDYPGTGSDFGVTFESGVATGSSSDYIGFVYNQGEYSIYNGSTTPVVTGSFTLPVSGSDLGSIFTNYGYDPGSSRKQIVGYCNPIFSNKAFNQAEIEYVVTELYGF